MGEEEISSLLHPQGGINPKVVAVHNDQLIKEVVEIMISKKISSVLIYDDHKKLSGIITERDIVRKFTLLEMQDKLEKHAITIATRPVSCVFVEGYEEEVINLYLTKNIRHFPVVNSPDPTIDNVVGILSIGDFLKQFIFAKKQKEHKETKTENHKIPLYYLAANESSLKDEKKTFDKLGIEIHYTSDFNEFVKKEGNKKFPLLFDLDSFPATMQKQLLPLVKKYPHPLLVITQNASLIPSFRFYLDPTHQTILLKPIDYSYCYWLLTYKWKDGV